MEKKTKPLLIIVEGPQGSGKTSITNEIREQLNYTNLFRLSGCKSDDPEMPATYHRQILNMLLSMSMYKIDNNVVLDRSFLSEWVYTRCGYKQDDTYSFDCDGWSLVEKLDSLTSNYRVVIVNLMLSDVSLYINRLDRNKPTHKDLVFDTRNSVMQQVKYGSLIDCIHEEYPSIVAVHFDTSTYDGVHKATTSLLEHIERLYKQ